MLRTISAAECANENCDATLLDWVTKHAMERPSQTAFMDENGVTLSYQAVLSSGRRLASSLSRLGLEKGDIVAVQLPNMLEMGVAYLGSTAIGLIFQTVHMPYRGAERRFLLEHSGARAFIGLNAFKETAPAAEVLALKDELPALEHVIGLGRPVEGIISFTDMLDAKPMRASVAAPEDDFLLLHTSGTTADPKGIVHTYRRFLPNAAEAAREMQLGSDDRIFCMAPYTQL